MAKPNDDEDIGKLVITDTGGPGLKIHGLHPTSLEGKTAGNKPIKPIVLSTLSGTDKPRVIAAAPETPKQRAEKLYIKAEELFNIGNPGAAIAKYTEAMNILPPTDSKYLRHQAIAYTQTGDYAEAEQVLLRAISAFPEDARLHATMGQLYEKFAVEYYKLALQKDTTDTETASRLDLLLGREKTPPPSPEK